MKRQLAIFALLVLCVSCVSTNAVQIGTAPRRAAVPWTQVAVYRTADQVPGKYEEVAMLVSTGDALWTNEAAMWNSMKKRAGKMGANAIILDAMSEPGAGAKVAAAFLGVGGADRKGKAVAIFVLPPETKHP
ncbi:MAG: hypothetical protein ABFD52_09025 [Acidobacteriota bacterium]